MTKRSSPTSSTSLACRNQSAECYPTIIDKAKAAGALVAVNAGVRQLSARGGAFLDSLGKVDILAINRPEADLLVPALVAKIRRGRI